MTLPLTTKQLEHSLQMGLRYLLRQQRSNGSFNYEYNWRERAYSPSDNAVRQAGVLWGLALTLGYRADPEVLAACHRGLDFFERNSVLTTGGGRYVRYPRSKEGLTGTIALLALALIELIRFESRGDERADPRLHDTLEEYLRFLLAAQNQRGLWHSRYRHVDGAPHGGSSAFFDGEALLALVKAVKLPDYAHLRQRVIESAAAGYRYNVLLELNKRGDKRTIARGYYQWGLMAFCELLDSTLPEVEQYAEPVFYLGDMKTRQKASPNNQGAVLEGLIHAYVAAAQRDAERAESYRRLIVRDLGRMLALQVRNPRSLGFLSGSESDPEAVGGFQHYPDQPTLRIDFTQHALHALLLAIRCPGLLEENNE